MLKKLSEVQVKSTFNVSSRLLDILTFKLYIWTKLFKVYLDPGDRSEERIFKIKTDIGDLGDLPDLDKETNTAGYPKYWSIKMIDLYRAILHHHSSKA